MADEQVLGKLIYKIEADLAGLKRNLADVEKAIKASSDKVADRMKQAVGQGLSETMGVISNAANSLAGALGSLGIATSIAGAFQQMVTASRDADNTMRRMEAMLRASGNAARLTADDIKNLADSIESLTLFDDDAAKQAITAMLAFDRVSGDVFKRAIKSSADLASAMEMGLPEAARLLGRALHDPEHGIQMLNRSLRLFDEAEMRAIKRMIEANNLAGAQALVLGKVESRFKGVAEYMNTGYAGAFANVTKSWDNFIKALGRSDDIRGPIVTALNGIAGAIKFLEDHIDTIKAALVTVAPVISVVFGAGLLKMIGSITVATWAWTAALLANPVIGGAALIAAAIGVVVGAMGLLATSMVGLQNESVTTFDIVKASWIDFANYFGSAFEELRSTVTGFWGSFETIASEAIADVPQRIADMVSSFTVLMNANPLQRWAIDVFSSILQTVLTFTAVASTQLRDWLNVGIGVFVALRDLVLETVPDMWEAFKTAFSRVREMAGAFWQDLREGNISSWTHLSAELERGFQGAFVNAWDRARGRVKTALETDYVSASLEGVEKAIEAVVQRVATALTAIMESTSGEVRLFMQAIVDDLRVTGERISKTARDLKDKRDKEGGVAVPPLGTPGTLKTALGDILKEYDPLFEKDQKFLRDLKTIEAALKSGAISGDQYNRMLAVMFEKFATLEEKLDRKSDQLFEIAEAYLEGSEAGELLTKVFEAQDQFLTGLGTNLENVTEAVLRNTAAQQAMTGAKAIAELRNAADATDRLARAYLDGAEALADAEVANKRAQFELQNWALKITFTEEKWNSFIRAYEDGLRRAASSQLLVDMRRQTDDLGRQLDIARKQIGTVSLPDEQREQVIALYRLELDFMDKKAKARKEDLPTIESEYQKQKKITEELSAAGAKLKQMEDERQLWIEPFKNAIASLQGAFSNLFEEIFSGGVKSFGDLAKQVKAVFIKLASEIATLLIFRPVVGNLLGSLASATGSSALATLARAYGGGAGGGVGGTDVLSVAKAAIPTGPGNGISNFIDQIGHDYFGIGQQAPSLGTETGSIPVQGGLSGYLGAGLSTVGAGFSIFNAVQNPNIGTIAGAVGSTALAANSIMGALGMAQFIPGPWQPVVAAVSALLSMFGGGLFGKKKHPAASYGFLVEGGPDTGYSFGAEDTRSKHMSPEGVVRIGREILQPYLSQMGQRYGVDYGPEQVFSAYGDERFRLGVGGVSTSFDFDPNDANETKDALARLTVQLLRLADSVDNADVKTAAMNIELDASGEQIEKFLTFADNFSTNMEYMASGLSPLSNQMKTLRDSASQSADEVLRFVTEFKETAEVLKLGTEEGVTANLRNFVDVAMGLTEPGTAALVGVALEFERVKVNMEALRPVLRELGYSADEATAKINEAIEKGVRRVGTEFMENLRAGNEQATGRTYLTALRGISTAAATSFTDALAAQARNAITGSEFTESVELINSTFGALVLDTLEQLDTAQLRDVIDTFANATDTAGTFIHQLAVNLMGLATAAEEAGRAVPELLNQVQSINQQAAGSLSRINGPTRYTSTTQMFSALNVPMNTSTMPLLTSVGRAMTSWSGEEVSAAIDLVRSSWSRLGIEFEDAQAIIDYLTQGYEEYNAALAEYTRNLVDNRVALSDFRHEINGTSVGVTELLGRTGSIAGLGDQLLTLGASVDSGTANVGDFNTVLDFLNTHASELTYAGVDLGEVLQWLNGQWQELNSTLEENAARVASVRDLNLSIEEIFQPAGQEWQSQLRRALGLEAGASFGPFQPIFDLMTNLAGAADDSQLRSLALTVDDVLQGLGLAPEQFDGVKQIVVSFIAELHRGFTATAQDAGTATDALEDFNNAIKAVGATAGGAVARSGLSTGLNVEQSLGYIVGTERAGQFLAQFSDFLNAANTGRDFWDEFFQVTSTLQGLSPDMFSAEQVQNLMTLRDVILDIGTTKAEELARSLDNLGNNVDDAANQIEDALRKEDLNTSYQVRYLRALGRDIEANLVEFDARAEREMREAREAGADTSLLKLVHDLERAKLTTGGDSTAGTTYTPRDFDALFGVSASRYLARVGARPPRGYGQDTHELRRLVDFGTSNVIPITEYMIPGSGGAGGGAAGYYDEEGNWHQPGTGAGPTSSTAYQNVFLQYMTIPEFIKQIDRVVMPLEEIKLALKTAAKPPSPPPPANDDDDDGPRRRRVVLPRRPGREPIVDEQKHTNQLLVDLNRNLERLTGTVAGNTIIHARTGFQRRN